MSKYIIASVFILSILIIPSFSFAINTITSASTDLQAIIQGLAEQIKTLQKQLEDLQSQVQEVKAELKFVKILQKGVVGDDVIQLQTYLKQFPDIYPEGLVTGIFGSLTEKAVKKFQEKYNIESIGIVGPKTTAKLNELIVEGLGRSINAPSGFLSAPGIENKLEEALISTSSVAIITPFVATTTPSETIPATPAIPAVPLTSRGSGVIPASPAILAQPATTTPTPTPTPEPIIYTSIIQDNFNSYAEGSVIGQGQWENYVNGTNFVIQSSTIYEGLRAMYIGSHADSVIGKKGNALSDGKQSFYIKTDRNGWVENTDGNAQVRVSKNLWASGIQGLPFVAVSFKKDGSVNYYDPIEDKYISFATYNDNEWTILEIEWRSSDARARYRVNSGTWTDWYAFTHNNNFIDFDYVGFDFILTGGSGGVYFDNLF